AEAPDLRADEPFRDRILVRAVDRDDLSVLDRDGQRARVGTIERAGAFEHGRRTAERSVPHFGLSTNCHGWYHTKFTMHNYQLTIHNWQRGDGRSPEGRGSAAGVIVGGGSGGLDAARPLAGVPGRVRGLAGHNSPLSQPLLYQGATASLSPADIASPIR